MFEVRRKKVLVVDDEPLMADTLCLILNRKGFEAMPAYSGEEALALARMLTPDVLVVDVTMENMNGIQTARRICENHPGCRVLLISGHSVNSDLLESAQCDGLNFEFLARPVHPTVFIDRLSA